ncbi:BMS1-like ribosome biogenesis protein [Reticulomyxa filosa]|uniref:BMS1-like ribosome biogenesis protein n=1 Tax=Reticulomyxa filosa TaxID=46433 RepID=X6NG73_RETFI|nr:BMS1-like ribosome biogenesis protein [Reticulomyxa filosa]|eukprot:ETO25330.1 BMS1-like ribosome biogenesis protein [Reticulomyxa filosa]
MPVSAGQENKKHAAPGNSVSKRKKEAARNKKLGITKPEAFNIKANTQSNINSKWKHIKRLMDREHTKHHALLPKRITEDMLEPPVYVAVVGPPKVGKSLLIRSLVKHYTTTKLTDCRGPMTILASNHRRITFLECPNELNAMIDVAKTCDLALLLVDASYGFEMETFEFLNCAQLHGFPRVMGVLTHLDKYVKLQKKQSIVYHVKHRFWKEIYSGAKLFVLKGIDKKIGQLYYKTDIRNLVRFISVLKFRPLQWRNTHPYMLVDRYEDLTEPVAVKNNPKIDRTVAFYGYIRGCNFRSTMNVHLCGVGDFFIKEMEEMEDPVPLPQKRMRHLVKSGKIYAPMANIGPIVFDKHAAYITLRNDSRKAIDKNKQSWESDKQYLQRLKLQANEDENVHYADIKTGNAQLMIEQMSKATAAMDDRMKDSTLQIFADSKPIRSEQLEVAATAAAKANKNSTFTKANADVDAEPPRTRRRVIFDDEVSGESGNPFGDSFDNNDTRANNEENENEDEGYEFNNVDEWIQSNQEADEHEWPVIGNDKDNDEYDYEQNEVRQTDDSDGDDDDDDMNDISNINDVSGMNDADAANDTNNANGENQGKNNNQTKAKKNNRTKKTTNKNKPIHRRV